MVYKKCKIARVSVQSPIQRMIHCNICLNHRLFARQSPLHATCHLLGTNFLFIELVTIEGPWAKTCAISS